MASKPGRVLIGGGSARKCLSRHRLFVTVNVVGFFKNIISVKSKTLKARITFKWITHRHLHILFWCTNNFCFILKKTYSIKVRGSKTALSTFYSFSFFLLIILCTTLCLFLKGNERRLKNAKQYQLAKNLI